MAQDYWDRVSENIRQKGIAEITAPNRIISQAEIARLDGPKGYVNKLDRSYPTDREKSYNTQEVPLVKPSNMGLVLLGILGVAALLLIAVPLFV